MDTVIIPISTSCIQRKLLISHITVQSAQRLLKHSCVDIPPPFQSQDLGRNKVKDIGMNVREYSLGLVLW